jgi:hypothetical protein
VRGSHAVRIALAAGVLLAGAGWQVAWAARPRPEGVPAGLRGFAGMLRGTVVRKGDRDFVLHVKAVTRVWKPSTAPAPKAAIGRNIAIYIAPGSRWGERLIRALAECKAGDMVEVDVAHGAGPGLQAIETLEKLGPPEDDETPPKGRAAELERKIARLETENEELESRVRALLRQVADLKAELRALRAQNKKLKERLADEEEEED